MTDILSMLLNACVVDIDGSRIATVEGVSFSGGKMVVTIDLDEDEDEEDDDDPESIIPEDGFNKIIAIAK